MTAPEVALGRYGRVDPGASYGVVTAYTGENSLTSAQSGLWCTNEGAVIPVLLHAPPEPEIGDNFTLERTANFAFRFKPDAADSIHGGAVGKYVELLDFGILTFEYMREGYWMITRDSAPWAWEQ